MEQARSYRKFRATPRSFFNCYNNKGIKLMTRLRLGLSHLREHKFNHNFVVVVWISNQLITFFLHCPIFDNKRITHQRTLSNIDCKLIETNESSLTKTLLFGNSLFDSKKNSLILNASIDYILSTKRFEEPLL